MTPERLELKITLLHTRKANLDPKAPLKIKAEIDQAIRTLTAQLERFTTI